MEFNWVLYGEKWEKNVHSEKKMKKFMPLAGELGMLYLCFEIVAMKEILSLLHGWRCFAYRVISFTFKKLTFLYYDHYDSLIKLL